MRSFLFCAVLTTAIAASASAQGGSLDLSASSLTANQAVNTAATPLIAGRSTFVRTGVQALGAIPPGASFDGLMRVYVNGAELAGSPFFSEGLPKDLLKKSTYSILARQVSLVQQAE